MLNQYLAQTRIQTLVQEAQPLLQKDGGIWGNRVPDTPATDEEIIARETNTVTAADLILDDQAVPIRTEPGLDIVTHKVTNLKRHTVLTQGDLNLLDMLQRTNGDPELALEFDRFLARRVTNALRSVKILRGIVIAGMVVDSFAWDRLGVKLNLTFGMHNALKVTPGVLWTTPGSATPVSDVQGMNVVASEQYGFTYDRLTMSRYAYNLMLGTTEYQDKAKGASGMYLAANLPAAQDPRSAVLASAVLGMQIEIDDSQYQLESADGSIVTGNRYVPQNKVVLTNSAFDGDPSVWNFGNCIVTESIVASFSSGEKLLPARVRGPIGYAAPANPTLNPPQLSVFGVQRGMARRMNRAVSAVLTVAA